MLGLVIISLLEIFVILILTGFTLIVNTFFVSVLTRAKLFRGKKVHGDYDIKVEQVGFTKAVISFEVLT